MIAGFVLWQPANGQRLRDDYVKMSIALPAADELYGKDKRFQKVIPENIEELMLLTDKFAGGLFGRLSFSTPLPAKAVNEKKGEKPDIIFELVSPGIQDFAMGQPYIIESKRLNPANNSVVATRGFVSDITYSFPIKIEVKDALGNLKRTIIVSDEAEKFRMTFHAEYLKEREVGDKSLVFQPAVFGSLKNYEQWLEKVNQNEIITRTAKNQLEILLKSCSEAVRICYDNYLSRKTFVVYIKTLSEWNDPANAVLTKAVETHKAAFPTIYDDAAAASLAQTLQPSIELYENYLQEHGPTVKNLRKLCLYNLVTACYFSWDFDKAAQYYDAYYREFGSILREYDDLFGKIYAWRLLKQSNMVYYAPDFLELVEETVNNERREIERQKAIEAKEASEAAYRELHIRGAGTVTDLNGDKFTGDLTMDLVSEGGILNLDAGRIVSLRAENDFRTFKLKNVKEIEVGNAVYRPVTIASRFMSSLSTTKLVYQKGKYALLYDPVYKGYYIKSDTQDKAYYINDILQATKVGEQFHQSCPSLKTELSGVKKPADVDGLKELTDKIEQLCQ
jgi:hypothetical protein